MQQLRQLDHLAVTAAHEMGGLSQSGALDRPQLVEPVRDPPPRRRDDGRADGATAAGGRSAAIWVACMLAPPFRSRCQRGGRSHSRARPVDRCP